MTKIRNQKFVSEDHGFLRRLADEYAYIGRPHKLDLANNTLTVFALPQRKPKRPKREHEDRNKRAESAGRHLTR